MQQTPFLPAAALSPHAVTPRPPLRQQPRDGGEAEPSAAGSQTPARSRLRFPSPREQPREQRQGFVSSKQYLLRMRTGRRCCGASPPEQRAKSSVLSVPSPSGSQLPIRWYSRWKESQGGCSTTTQKTPQ